MSALRRISLAVFLSFPPSCSGLLKVHFKRPVSGTPNITSGTLLRCFSFIGDFRYGLGGELDSLRQVSTATCVDAISNNRDLAVGVKLRLDSGAADGGKNEEEAYKSVFNLKFSFFFFFSFLFLRKRSIMFVLLLMFVASKAVKCF